MTGSGKHRLDGFVDRAFEPGRAAHIGDVDRRLAVEDVSGSCTVPVIVRKSRDGKRMLDREFHVRCRRCPSCLRSRQFLWRLRGEVETLAAPQTVMFTGTFAEQTWDREVCSERITRWLKRARYYCGSGFELRYLVVPERHKSGAWHCHALLHSEPISKAVYEDSWGYGFTKAKYADWDSAGYVTKYVAKNLLDDSNAKVPRIRCSRSPAYGGWVMEQDKEKVRELLANQSNESIRNTWKKNLDHLLRDLERLENESLMDQWLREMNQRSLSPQLISNR